MISAMGWTGRALAITVAAVALFALAAGDGGGHTTRAAESSHALDLIVQRPGGPPVQLAFELRADSPEQAYAAAVRAVAQLIPGGTIVESGEPGVSAQWRAWGWAWDDGELPVRVAYNPVGAPAYVGPDAIAGALQTWSSVPTSRFAYAYGGFTDRTASLRDSGPDGANVIAWQSLDCTGGCVLGVTTRETAHESDLILNSNPDAHLGNGSGDTVDAKTVILHETGHMAGLEHSCEAPLGSCTSAELDAVMYYQYRGTKRKLAADDLAGISAIYPARPSGPGATPSVPPAPPASNTIAVVLQPGWNLSQLPEGLLKDELAPLGCAEALYRYNGSTWDWWLRDAAPALNTLTAATSGEAYWIFASAPCARVFG